MIKFFNNFDESSYKLILSYYNPINKNEKNKLTNEIKNKINLGQIDYPKQFPSEIYRYFFDKIGNLDILYDENGDFINFNNEKINILLLEEEKKKNSNFSSEIFINVKNSVKNSEFNMDDKKKIYINKNSSKILEYNKSLIKEEKMKINLHKIIEYEFYLKSSYISINKSPIIKVFLNNTIVYYYNNQLQIFKIEENNIEYKKKDDFELKFKNLETIDIKDNIIDNNDNSFYNNDKLYCYELYFRNNKKDLCLITGSKKGILLIFIYDPDKDEKFTFKHHFIINHSITCIENYRCTNIILVGTILGEFIIIDIHQMKILKRYNLHKGNITKIGFINNYEILYTTSGSFSGNQDNSLNLIQIELVHKEVFLKKLNRICNLHGNRKGIINGISTNQENDYYIYTSGSFENRKICVIDGKKRTKIYSLLLDFAGYYMTIISGKYLNSILTDMLKKIFSKNCVNNKEEIEGLRMLVISGIKEIIIVIICIQKNLKFHNILNSIKLNKENGCYFRTLQLIKIENCNFINILVSNIQGNIEHFIIN